MAHGMSSLYVGSSGLKSAQTALNTTAHNLANVDTKGYTRQQIAFQDTQYVLLGDRNANVVTSTYGLGVGVAEIRRIRDQFIDSAYRSENSRLGYYSSQYKAIEEIEDQFGEMQGVTYQESLTNLYNALNEISKEPASTVKRSALIQNASAFLTRSEAIYKGLREYQTTLNVEVRNMIDRINELGDTIHTLNKQIAKVEAAGLESANDLRDQRDIALDELSGYVNISYYEVKNGEVIVSADHVPLVTVTSVNHMSSRTAEGTDLLIPTWPAFERDVYPESELYSTATDTDKGELKGLILARGSVYTDYQDVPVKPKQSDYDLTTNEGAAAYQNAYNDYMEKQEYYNKYIEPSVILSAIAGVDKLVNGIVEGLNGVFCPEKEVVTQTAMQDENGNDIVPDVYVYSAAGPLALFDKSGKQITGYEDGTGSYIYESKELLYTDADATTQAAPQEYRYSILDMDKTDYGMDDDRTVGEELFSRENTKRYIVIKDANGNDMYVRNNVNTRGKRSDYSLGNLQMNAEVAQNVAKIPMHTLQNKEDMARGQELIDVWNGDFASLNPEQYAVGDFNTFYNNYIGEFATVGKVLDYYVSHQQTQVDGYDNQRLQTEGVSSDEELQKMIKYQQAYNAASRYINVISEMLEHIVTSLGR